VALHPDRVDTSGPDGPAARESAEARFAEINNAYDVLSDKEQRFRYDRGGEQALQNGGGGGGGGGGGSMHFDMGGVRFHFGGGGFQQQQRQPPRPPPKPSADLYGEHSKVKHLDSGGFERVLDDVSTITLINFYAPWCDHCKQMVELYERVAKNLDGLVAVRAVNCERHKDLCASQGVRAYPHVAVVVGGIVTVVPNATKMDSAALSAAAADAIPDRVVRVNDAAGLRAAWAQRCGQGTWGVCLAVATKQGAKPSKTARALAYRFVGSASVIEVPASAGDDARALLGLSSVNAPDDKGGASVLCGGAVPTGDVDGARGKAVPYPADAKTTPGRLGAFVSSFADPKKCVMGEKIRPDAADLLARFGHGGLDAILSAMEHFCVGDACGTPEGKAEAVVQRMQEKGWGQVEL